MAIVIRTSAVLFLVLVAAEVEAKAYADPGTGALLWQALVAALAGLFFTSRRFAAWVRRVMDNRKRTGDS